MHRQPCCVCMCRVARVARVAKCINETLNYNNLLYIYHSYSNKQIDLFYIIT